MRVDHSMCVLVVVSLDSVIQSSADASTSSSYHRFFFNDTATTEIYTRIARRQRQMCIRDRIYTHQFSDLFNLCSISCIKRSFKDSILILLITSAAKAIFKNALAFCSPIPRAVSYTHLRAHETVLDLVCRLLLEKKKNNQTSTTLSFIT